VSEDETPFRMSRSGKVHVKRCLVGGGRGTDMTLTEVVDWVRRHSQRGARYVVIGAQCCGSSPESWLRVNRPEAFAELHAEEER
jgi:hypothetical protein